MKISAALFLLGQVAICSAASLRQTRKLRATDFSLVAENGDIEGIPSPDCSINGNTLRMTGDFNEYGVVHNCDFVIRFPSEQISCRGWTKIYVTDGNKYRLDHHIPCAQVTRTEGNQASGSAWPCQGDGCYYSMDATSVFVGPKKMPAPIVTNSWQPILSGDYTLTMTTATKLSESLNKYSEHGSTVSASAKYSFENSAGASISVEGEGVNAESKQGAEFSTAFTESWKEASSTEVSRAAEMSQTTTVQLKACEPSENRFQLFVNYDGIEVGTSQVVCESGDSGPPRCPSLSLCRSLKNGENDCQCCANDPKRLLSNGACPDSKVKIGA